MGAGRRHGGDPPQTVGVRAESGVIAAVGVEWYCGTTMTVRMRRNRIVLMVVVVVLVGADALRAGWRDTVTQAASVGRMMMQARLGFPTL